MIIRQLTPGLSVADQLTMDDLKAVKEAGFKAVICNRPDEEGEPHADADSMAQKADTLGLEFRYLPVNGANILTLMLHNMTHCCRKYRGLF